VSHAAAGPWWMAPHLGVGALVMAPGYAPLWWAAVLAAIAATGLLIPPMGLAVFTVAAGCDVPAAPVFRKMRPFLAGERGRLALLVAWPARATVRPVRLGGCGRMTRGESR